MIRIYRRTDSGRNVFHGKTLIATISQTDGEWVVRWANGRIDRHASLAEAKENAMKGV